MRDARYAMLATRCSLRDARLLPCFLTGDKGLAKNFCQETFAKKVLPRKFLPRKFL